MPFGIPSEDFHGGFGIPNEDEVIKFELDKHNAQTEQTYVDLINKLAADLKSDICIPKDVKDAAEEALVTLEGLLFAYSG